MNNRFYRIKQTEADLNMDLNVLKMSDYKSDVETDVVDLNMDFKMPEYKSDVEKR